MPAILLDLPAAFETARLLARVPMAGDGAALHDAILASRESLLRWPASLPWILLPQSVESSEAFCRRACSAFQSRSDFSMLLTLRDSGEVAGCLSLHPQNALVPAYKIGYWCRLSLQRRGLMTEAVQGLCRYARQSLNAARLEIRCDEQNLASSGVAERAGFVREACLHHDAITPAGELRNTLVFGYIPE